MGAAHRGYQRHYEPRSGASSYVASLYSADASRSTRLRVMAAGNWLNLIGSGFIGVVCLIGWVFVADNVTPPGWGPQQGLWAIVIMIVGVTTRGSLVVAAQAAMAARRFKLRDELLIGQTVVAIAFAWPLVEIMHSAWALPISYLAASIPFAIYGWLRLTSVAPAVLVTDDDHLVTRIDYGRIARQFAFRRTGSTLALAILLQADRWVLAGVATAAILGIYEVSWRLASIPRVVITSLSTYLIPHGVSLGPDESKVSRVVIRATLVATALGVVLCAIVFLGVHTLGLAPRSTPAWILLLLLASLTFNGLASPTSNIGVGRGQPGIDLRYLIPAVVGAVTVWGIGVAMDDYRVVIIGSTVPLIISCAVYILVGPRVANRYKSPPTVPQEQKSETSIAHRNRRI